MKYLIFNTEAEAKAVNTRITVTCDFKDGITTSYATIDKHPTEDKWALIVDDNYADKFTPQELASAVEKTEDWFIKEEEKFTLNITGNDYTIQG